MEFRVLGGRSFEGYLRTPKEKKNGFLFAASTLGGLCNYDTCDWEKGGKRMAGCVIIRRYVRFAFRRRGLAADR